MREDGWLSLKGKPRLKSQLFKFSNILFTCYFSYNKEEKIAGVGHVRFFFLRFRWVISYQSPCLYHVNVQPVDEVAVTQRKLLLVSEEHECFAYSSRCSDVAVFYFRRCKNNTEKRPSTLPANSQAPVLLEVKCSSMLLEGKLHTEIINWFV